MPRRPGSRPRQPERNEDRRRGVLDGHGRLPSLSDVSPYGESVQTERLFAPYPDTLAHDARSDMEGELNDYYARTAEARQRRAQLEAQIAAQEAAVVLARERVAAAELPVTDEEAEPRNPAESGRDDQWRHRRRAVMRERRIKRAMDWLDQEISRLASLQTELAKACQVLDREFDATRARVRAIGERAAARVATYWHGVASTHPDGKHLATLVHAVAPESPDWANVESKCGRLPATPAPTTESDVAFELAVKGAAR